MLLVGEDPIQVFGSFEFSYFIETENQNSDRIERSKATMNIKIISILTLSLFMLCGCSSSNQDQETMVSLEDYNSYYSEVLSSSKQ